jgi:hypothetical protein
MVRLKLSREIAVAPAKLPFLQMKVFQKEGKPSHLDKKILVDF